MLPTSEDIKQIRVWDIPTRIFHWLLVSSFIMAFLSYNDNRYLDVHVFAGFLFLGLLIFRLLWGVFGTHYARFKQFAYHPREVIAYLKGLFGEDMRSYIGHNPAGAWAIFALITLGLVLTISGIVVLGAEEQQGPLAGWLSFRDSPPFRELHEITAWGLLGLVFIHVCGVISESLLHRENLVGAMFRGTKWVKGESDSVPAHTLLGVAIVVAAASWGLVMFGGHLKKTPEETHVAFTGPPLPQNETWNTECGDCHLAFHPSLLPVRSWQRLLDEQNDHFGEELMLDQETIDELLAYSKANSAEQEATEAAWRFNTTIPTSEAPIKISATGYWKRKHQDIPDAVWKRPDIRSKTNCNACHLDAKQGWFEDAAMRIPGLGKQAPAAWIMSLFTGESSPQPKEPLQ